MPNPAEWIDFLSELMPREEAVQAVGRAGRQVLALRSIARRQRERVEPARAHCVAAFEQRFGAVPEGVQGNLDAMEPAMLRAAEDLVRRSADLAAFGRSFELLCDACASGKLLGARQVLRNLLRQKFGSIHIVHDQAIGAADSIELNACFERLATASDCAELVAPLLRCLGVDDDGGPGTLLGL